MYVDANIQQSNVREMRQHADKLFAEHYEEIARNKHIMQLAPNWDLYERLEKGDLLLIISAWDEAKLVGYSVSFLSHHLHYRHLLYAQNDVLFVSKEYRRGKLGLALIRETENLARQRGAKLMLWHAKQGTALDALMPRLKYQVQDIVYSKEL